MFVKGHLNFYLPAILLLCAASSAQNKILKSTSFDPIKGFIQFSLAGYDSSLHFILDRFKNFRGQESRHNIFIHKIYKFTRYKTIQISYYNRSLPFQKMDSGNHLQKRRGIAATHLLSSINHQKHSNLIVTDVYLSSSSARRILGRTQLKTIPHIILIYSDIPGTSESEAVPAKHFQRLRKALFTSIFVILDHSNSYLGLLCFTCDEGYEKLEGNFRYPSLLEKWTVINKNMRTARIDINVLAPADIYELVEASNCNTHEENVHTLRTFEDLCLHRILQQLLNYTFNPFRKLPKNLGRIHGEVDTKIVVDTKHVSDMQIQRFEIVGQGMFIDPYIFISVLNPPTGPVFAMLRPLDMVSWICLISAVFGYSIVLFLMPQVSKRLRLLQILMAMTGVILDQPTNVIDKIFKISKIKPLSIMLAWTLWTAMIQQLGNEYKGTMTSLLTAGSTPTEPSNLNELLDSHLPVLTRDGNNIETETVCAIRDLYLQDIMNAMEKPIPASNVFKRLRDSIEWIDTDPFRFGVSLSFNKPVIVMDKNESADLSQPFAIIETQREAEFRHSILNAFSDKWISKIHLVSDMLTSRQMTAVKKNYFWRFFKKGFSIVEEAGLYNRWKSYAWNVWQVRLLKIVQQRVFDEAAKIENKTGKSSQYRMNFPQNIRGFIFARADNHLSSNSHKEIVVSMMVHQTTFLLYIILKCMCICVFISELSFQATCRKRFV